MQISRRGFTLTAGSALAAALIPFPSASALARTARRRADTWFEWQKVGENAWAALGEGGNTLVFAHDGDWILVDTKNPGYADTLRREAGELVPKDAKLSRVINTHHHADHTGGNYAFAPGTAILAHEKAAPRIRDQVDRYKERIKGVPAQIARSEKPAGKITFEEAEKAANAADTFTADRFAPTLTVGDVTALTLGATAAPGTTAHVLLQHFGPGHTDNDIIVHIPALNLIHTGDLLFMGRHPVMDVGAGATITGWLKSLAGIIKHCDAKTVVIPGHGPVTDVEGVRTQVRYFETARAAVHEAMKAGRTRDEVMKLALDEFKDYASPQGRERVLGAAFDEFTKAADSK